MVLLEEFDQVARELFCSESNGMHWLVDRQRSLMVVAFARNWQQKRDQIKISINEKKLIFHVLKA
jgi:hypothetical protein